MNNLRCPICRGTKKVMTLGMLEKNCTACDGSGKIKSQVNTALNQPKDVDSKKVKSKEATL